MGIFPEMEDGGHVVFIVTGSDREEDLDRLEAALEQLRDQMGDCQPLPAPPLPKRAMSPRAALFSSTETVPLADSAGRVAACQLAPYPPGVPVVAPGEAISKKNFLISKK